MSAIDLGVLEAAAQLRARRALVGRADRRLPARGSTSATAARRRSTGAPDAVNAWARCIRSSRASRPARPTSGSRASGDDAPLLCGIPLGAQGPLRASPGLPLTASSRVLEGNVATEDAVAWARLRERGMVLLGHTHTHEFAAGGTTDQVGNPWALDARRPAARAAGRRAALAARHGPGGARHRHVRLAADPVGAVRHQRDQADARPVPIDGIIPLAPSLDHAGPMARSIADCAALLARAWPTGGPRPRR